MVSKAVFDFLDRIGKDIPGSHTSDLWSHEAVDPELKDFCAMGDRRLREKVADYIGNLKEYDNSVHA